MTNVIIVDDHHIVLDGMAAMLQLRPAYRVLGTATNGREGLQLLGRHPETGIVITDINMPDMNGLELCQHIKKNHPETKVVFLTMHNNEAVLHQALDAEADGILLKNSGMKIFFEALEKVDDGGTYYDRDLLPVVKARLQKEKWLAHREHHELSRRECEILVLITREMTSGQIAEQLFISKKTVDNHRANIMEKTGCKSTIGLVKYALQVGIGI